MQLASPGALGRIASQTAGRALLGTLAAALLLPALVTLADRATGRERGPLEPGAADALLHVSVATAGLELWLGGKLLTPSQHTLLLAGLGVLLAVVGVGLVAAGVVNGVRARGDARELSVRILQRRDGLVRGAVAIVLGAFLGNAAMLGVPDLSSGLGDGPWAVLLLVATAGALLGYAWHNLWLARVEDRLWSL
jgi:hypothetical protein